MFLSEMTTDYPEQVLIDGQVTMQTSVLKLIYLKNK